MFCVLFLDLKDRSLAKTLRLELLAQIKNSGWSLRFCFGGSKNPILWVELQNPCALLNCVVGCSVYVLHCERTVLNLVGFHLVWKTSKLLWTGEITLEI